MQYMKIPSFTNTLVYAKALYSEYSKKPVRQNLQNKSKIEVLIMQDFSVLFQYIIMLDYYPQHINMKSASHVTADLLE